MENWHVHRKIEKPPFIDLDEGVGSDPLEAPGFRLQLAQEFPKEFRQKFSALHSRERPRGPSGERGHHTWDSKDGGRKKGHSRNGV